MKKLLSTISSLLLGTTLLFGARSEVPLMVQATNGTVLSPTQFTTALITNQTEELTPSTANDYGLIYSGANGGPRKVKLENWPGSGSGSGIVAGTNAAAFFSITNSEVFTLGTSYQVLTNWDNNIFISFTGNKILGTLTNSTAGYYIVNMSCSFIGQVAGSPEYEVAFFTNGAHCAFEGERQTATTQKGSFSFNGFVYLPANTWMDLRAKSDTAGANFEVVDMQLLVVGTAGGTYVRDAGATNNTDRFGLYYGLLGPSNLIKTISAGYDVILTNEGTNIVIAIDPSALGGTIKYGSNYVGTTIGPFALVNGDTLAFNSYNTDQFASNTFVISIKSGSRFTNTILDGVTIIQGTVSVTNSIYVDSNVIAQTIYGTNIYPVNATGDRVAIYMADKRLSNSLVNPNELLMLTNLSTNLSLENRLAAKQPSNAILTGISVTGALTNRLTTDFETNSGVVGLASNNFINKLYSYLGAQEYVFYDDFNRSSTAPGTLTPAPSGHAYSIDYPTLLTSTNIIGRITNGFFVADWLTNSPYMNVYVRTTLEQPASHIGLSYRQVTGPGAGATNGSVVLGISASSDWATKSFRFVANSNQAYLQYTTNGTGGSMWGTYAIIGAGTAVTNNERNTLMLTYLGNDQLTISWRGTNLLFHHPGVDDAWGKYLYYGYEMAQTNASFANEIDAVWAKHGTEKVISLATDFNLSTNWQSSLRAESAPPTLSIAPGAITNQVADNDAPETVWLMGYNPNSNSLVKIQINQFPGGSVGSGYIANNGGSGTNTTFVGVIDGANADFTMGAAYASDAFIQNARITNLFVAPGTGSSNNYLRLTNATTGEAEWAEVTAASGITSGGTLHVMTNGNDTTGTRGRIDLPFLTLSNALFAATNGDAILIYPGEYIWNIGTNAYPHLISGKTNMAIVGIGKPTIYMSNSPYGQGIFIQDSRYITIDGLRLIGSPVKGQGDAGGNASCIRMDGANVENIIVQNCDIIDWAGHGVTHLNPERGSSRNVYVLNNYFSNIGSTNADSGTIIDGAAISGAGSDWIVSDNIISGGARGIEVEHIGYANSRGVLISGNILEGVMGQNIMVAVGQGGDALQQVYLSDNIIRGWLTNSYGIIATNDNYGIGILDCRNLVCKGNSIYDVWAAGISWAITTNSGVGLIMGNVVSGARWQGIQVRHSSGGTDNVKDVLIANNVTENTGFTGIEIDASDVMIIGNRIKNAYNRDAAQSAIWLRQLYADSIEPTNAVVMNNFITKDTTAATTGIKVDTNVYDTKIFGNIFGAGIKPYSDSGNGTRYGIPTNNFMALSTDASPSSSDFLMVLDSTGSNVFKTAIGSLPFSLTDATNLVVAATNGVLTLVTNIYGTVSNNIYNGYSYDIFTAADEVTNYINAQLLITNLYTLNTSGNATNLTNHGTLTVSNITILGSLVMSGTGQATSKWYNTYTDVDNYSGFELAADVNTNILQAITAGTGSNDISIEIRPVGTGTINLNGPLKEYGYVQTTATPAAWGVSTNYVITDFLNTHQTFACVSNAYHFIHSTNKPSDSTTVRSVRYKIYAGPTNRFVSFNASWNPITTNRFIHSNGIAFLTIECDGPYETNVSAILLSQPTP